MYSDHGGGHSSSLWHLFSFISVVKKNKTKKYVPKSSRHVESRAPPPSCCCYGHRDVLDGAVLRLFDASRWE